MMPRMRRAWVLLICAASAAWQAADPQVAHAATVTIDDIRRAWQERQRAVRTATFEWTEKCFVAAGTMEPPDRRLRKGEAPPLVPPNDITFERKDELSFDGNMMRYSSTGPTLVPDLGEFLPRRYVSTFDGEVAKNFHGEDASGARRFHPAGFIAKEKVSYDKDNGALTALLTHYRGCDESIGGVDLRQYAISSKAGTIGGRSCAILQPINRPEFGKSIWVDQSRGCLVVRLERSFKGRPQWTLDVDYERDAVNGWVPSKWKHVEKGGTFDKVIAQVEAEVTRYRLNGSIPRSDFQFVYPPGTRVSDRRNGDYYIVRDDDAKRMITKAEVAAGATYNEMLNSESGMAKARRFPWRTVIWAALAIVVAAGLVLAYRRRVSRYGS